MKAFTYTLIIGVLTLATVWVWVNTLLDLQTALREPVAQSSGVMTMSEYAVLPRDIQPTATTWCFQQTGTAYGLQGGLNGR